MKNRYKYPNNVPDEAKVLPPDGQKKFVSMMNSYVKENPEDEIGALRASWALVSMFYKKGENGSDWVTKNSTSKDVVLEAHHFKMSPIGVASLIPEDVMASIKSDTKDKVIKVYSIGHEGVASGSVEGLGNKVIRYARKVIAALSSKICVGTAVFFRHDTDGSSGGREKIGTVVGKGTKLMNGVLHALAAVRLADKWAEENLNVASIEARIAYEMDKLGSMLIGIDVENVTGLALSSSEIDTPGFPESTLLGAIRAFTPRGTSHAGEKPMTKEQLIAAINEGKFTPSDLFGKDILSSDRVVVEIVRAEKQTEYEHAKRVETRLEDERKKSLENEKKYSEEIRKLRVESKAHGMSTEIETIVKDRKIDNPKLVEFIKRSIGEIRIENPDDDVHVKSMINKHIDAKSAEFRELEKIFNDKQQSSNDKQQSSNSQQNSDKGNNDVSPDDMTAAENNDLIPKYDD